jgi:hypothetical protein
MQEYIGGKILEIYYCRSKTGTSIKALDKKEFNIKWWIEFPPSFPFKKD